jgi:integrase
MAKRAGRTHRRAIRINGVLIQSPTFPNKAMADKWYAEKSREKEFIKFGLLSGSAPTFEEYSARWIMRRMKKNPKSTWAGENQKLTEYLLPHLSSFSMDKITRQMMKTVLMKITDELGLSIGTRTLVKALASKIFTDAMNENPPLIQTHPVARMTFDDAREGKEKPQVIDDADEVLAYLRAAAAIGPRHTVIAILGLMAGLRKSEKIALRWSSIKWKRKLIVVTEHCEQASLSIKPGSKGGRKQTREIPVPDELLAVLAWYRERTPFASDHDFILTRNDGDWIRPRDFQNYVVAIRERYGKHVTDHQLRHTFAALFAGRTGNLQALMQMLGHRQLSTTQIYSEISGRQLQSFRETVSVSIADEVTKSMDLADLSTKSLPESSEQRGLAETALKQRKGRK